ncbi:MAG: diaminopimelate epimerase [Planctomycetes bacterium]|jgi:diaminopimelate epimerase|nr:diaminopimelate epimerase [Phycisphaerae bacterium]NBB94459.1 diaminopimelate epimerase [Planctomycetota bacterium]
MSKAPIDFWKLSAAGNDFICIDARGGSLDTVLREPRKPPGLARKLCARGHGIGADGVFFATRPDIEGVADIAALHYEADGSECELCGNGTGCFTYWVSMTDVVPNRRFEQIRILTPAGVVLGQNLDEAYVRVCIPTPEGELTDLRLEAAGREFACDFVITGIPHVITYVEDVEQADVDRWGYALRHHEEFQPRGANANFVQVLGEGEIALRTWEFGVEGETLACGTGSAASAIMTALREGWGGDIVTGEQPVLVHTRGGYTLRMAFTLDDDGHIDDCCLDTPVRLTYTGRLHPDYVHELTDC